MANEIRERFAALTLQELHDIGAQHRGDQLVQRLLWEIRALQSVVRDAKRLEATHYYAYPESPEGMALLQLRSSLEQEKWLGEKLIHGKAITLEEKRAHTERNGRGGSTKPRR